MRRKPVSAGRIEHLYGQARAPEVQHPKHAITHSRRGGHLVHALGQASRAEGVQVLRAASETQLVCYVLVGRAPYDATGCGAIGIEHVICGRSRRPRSI